MKLDSICHPEKQNKRKQQKQKSFKWMKNLDIKPETMRLLEENKGNTLQGIGVGKEFLNRTPFS